MCSHTSFHDTSPAGFLSSLYLGNDFGYFKYEFSLKFVNTTTTTGPSSFIIIFSDVGDDAGEITDGDGSKDDRTRKQPREEEDKEEEEREVTFSRFVLVGETKEKLLKEAQEEDIFISFCICCVTLLTLECTKHGF